LGIIELFRRIGANCPSSARSKSSLIQTGYCGLSTNSIPFRTAVNAVNIREAGEDGFETICLAIHETVSAGISYAYCRSATQAEAKRIWMQKPISQLLNFGITVYLVLWAGFNALSTILIWVTLALFSRILMATIFPKPIGSIAVKTVF